MCFDEVLFGGGGTGGRKRVSASLTQEEELDAMDDVFENRLKSGGLVRRFEKQVDVPEGGRRQEPQSRCRVDVPPQPGFVTKRE